MESLSLAPVAEEVLDFSSRGPVLVTASGGNKGQQLVLAPASAGKQVSLPISEEEG